MNAKRVIYKSIFLSVLSLFVGVPAQAATINLGGLGYVTYGDGNSYSLPVANLQFGFNTNNGPYAIASTPGQIQDLTVVATGSSGTGVTTNAPSIDNAYETPNAAAPTYFYADPSNLNTPNPNGDLILNNGPNTWDVSISALLNFLAGDDMVFFFNNNQENSGDTSNQELAAWARIWITDAAGNQVGTAYEFTNIDSRYDIVTNGGGGVPFGDPAAYTASGSGFANPSSASAAQTDFVLAGGQVCVEYVPGNSAFTPIPVACDASPSFYPGGVVSAPINHNLGADHAAYAVIFPELNAQLAALALSGGGLSGYTLHFDGRFGCTGPTSGPTAGTWMSSDLANGHGTCLNNGFEQVFIGTADIAQVGPAVPEPGTLTLVALGISLVGIAVRRRRVVR